MGVDRLYRTVACDGCQVSCIGQPHGLPAESVRQFEQLLTRRILVPAGEELIRGGELDQNFYAVRAGWICQYRLLSDGRQQNVRIVLPGDVLGLSPPGQPNQLSAMALTESLICVGSRAALWDVMARDPQLALRFSRYLLKDRFSIRERLIMLGRASAIERIAHFLIETFARTSGRAPSAGDRCAFPLTQEKLADAVGLSIIHVSRTMTKLRQQQLVTLMSGTLTFIDPDGLKALAKCESNPAAARPTAGATPPCAATARPATPARPGNGFGKPNLSGQGMPPRRIVDPLSLG